MFPMVSRCSECRVCSGAGYQCVPFLFTGNPDSKVIVLAQNPGEIKAPDPVRFELAHHSGEFGFITNETERGRVLETLYRIDFSSSSAYRKLGEIFGAEWLDRLLFTNAVRCRTMDNASPSDEMIQACATWTRILIERPSVKGIVFLGRVALNQVLGADAPSLPLFALRKHGKSGRFMLSLPHFASREWGKVDEMRASFERLYEMANT